jgi:plastocyanin
MAAVPGVLLVGVLAYVGLTITRDRAPVAKASPGEYIQGIKRMPGVQDGGLSMGSGLDTLGTPDITIEIKAVRPVFIPTEVRVKQGQVVRLLVTGLDNGLADMPGVDEAVGLNEFSGHGFQILGPYDVWVTGIRKGVTKEIVFRASEAGEFPFECVVFCHPNHYLMQGKLIVEPS